VLRKSKDRRAQGPGREPPTGKSQPAKECADSRTAPDPFSIVLPALSALAAVSSIATIHWAAEDRESDRPRSRRKATTSLRDLETCCMGLSEIFKRFQNNPRAFSGDGRAASLPLKFGVHGPRLPADQVRQYQQLANDVASMLVLASQNAFDVMAAIEDGEIDPPEEIFFGFGECQEQLNKILLERLTLRAAVEIGADVARRLIELVRELRQHHSE